MSLIYPGGDAQVTPNLGLATWGMDEVLAENMILLDIAIGAGSSVKVNGVSVSNPNFNGTLPAAPGGDTNVTFQTDINGNVSAFVPTSGTGTVTSVSSGNIDTIATVSVATSTTTPAISFALSTQAANTVWAGPTSGSAANPTFRAFVAADFPASTVPWSSLGNAAANLTLANAAFTTTFNQTSAVAWLWANTTAATSLTNVGSPVITLSGASWNGSASVVDSWTIQKASFSSGSDVSSLIIAKPTATGSAGKAVCIQAPLFVSGTAVAITGASAPLGTSFAIIDPTPIIMAINSVSNTNPTGQWRQLGSGQAVFWGLGSGQYTGDQGFEIYGGAGIGINTAVFTIKKTTGFCGIGRNNLTPGTTLTVFDALASTGATQLLVQGGAVAADATTNVLFRINTGGGTAQSLGILGNGTLQFSTDTGISRLGAASLALGNGTAGDFTGALTFGALTQNNNTIATALTTNSSPIRTFSANYWTGAASAPDTWTAQSSLAAGTNGASTLNIAHAGSSGNAQVLFPTGTSTFPSIAVRSNQGIGSASTATLQLITGTVAGSLQIGSTANASCVGITTSNSPTISSLTGGSFLTLAGQTNGQTNQSSVVINNSGATMTGTVTPNGLLNVQGTFAPTTGTFPFFGLSVTPVINQSGAGNGTVRVIAGYAVNTALVGTEYLLALGTTTAAGLGGTFTDLFTVDSFGNMILNRTNKAGADHAGQATITAASTTKAVTFSANYTGTGQPVIVITPTSDPLVAGVPVGYWITYSGGAGAWTGFTVNIQTALAANVTFNYIVVGVA